MSCSDESSQSQNSVFHVTSLTLLRGLRASPPDAVAWNRFVSRYQILIVKWCLSWGLQASDCQDVTQEVLLRLSKAMRDFDYDPQGSFRGWLKTVTHHAWVDWIQSQRKPGRGRGDSAMQQMLQQVEAGEDLARRLEEEYDTELMETALLRVRGRVQPRTWQAFQMTAIEGHSGAQAAAKLKMQVAHVYVAKSEILKALRAEIQTLDPLVSETIHATSPGN